MSDKRLTVSVTESIHVGRTPERVFDYTQDYGHRPEWDPAITEAEVLGDSPRAVRVTVRSVGSLTIAYRLFRRPERTSAAFVDVSSAWVMGGGGSWDYSADAGGTTWTQTNTLELRPGLIRRLLRPLIARNLRSNTRRSMARAKQILESA